MKINTQKPFMKRKSFIVLIIVVAVLLLAGGYTYKTLNSNETKVSEDTSVLQRSESDLQQADRLSENPKNKETSSNSDTPPPTSTDESTGKQILQMTTSANIVDTTVYIRGGINNAVVSDGTCYAELTDSSGTVTKKDTTLLQNASTTDCKTVTFNKSELTPGSWKVKLIYTSNTAEGASNEASFTID